MKQDEWAMAGQVVLGQLSALRVGEGVSHERMAVFPVFSGPGVAADVSAESGVGEAAQNDKLDYRTLQEGLAEGWVEIVERATATVPELVLRNRGGSMVLVLDGEEIVGGKQNRIVNASFLVAAGAEVALPVSCVEHGRWHDVSPRFSAGEASYFSLRREKMEHVHSNLRAGGGHVADQGAIWNHIAEKEEVAGSASPTRAMHDLYRHRVDDIGEYARAFPYMDGAVGMIVAMNGRIAGGDLFDQARTAGSLWGKLIRSYAMDALDGGRGVSVSRERAKRLLERTRGARCEAYPSLALGVDVRLMGDGMVGAALVYRDTPVHVSLFRTHGGQGRSKSGMVRSSLRRGFRMSGPQGGPTRRD